MRHALAAALLLSAGSALADDIVVTATRLPTLERDIPAGVTVVDRETMEARNYATVTEALSAIPGIRVAQSGGAGGNASVFVRGANSNQVLVLRDGLPLNDAADASGAFNFGVDTPADIERIEVIRGPMAALYGSGAIGGVINLITRQGRAPGLHVFGDLSGGYPRAILGNAGVSGVTGPFDYLAMVESQSRLGFDSTPQRETVYSGMPQGFRNRIATVNLGWAPVEGTRLSALLRAREAVFGFNALGSPTFDDANSTGRDSALLGRVGVTSKLFDGAYETSAYVGRLQQDRRYVERLNARDPNQASNDSRYHGQRTDVQWNNAVHFGKLLAVPGASSLDLTFGYEHISDAAKVSVGSTFQGFPFTQNVRAHQDSDAGYVGLQARIWQRLLVTAQARQEAVLDNAPFTWRFGGVVEIPEIATRFKAAYGTAFRAPSLFELHGVDNFGFAGNPRLRPEKAQGWEIGFSMDAPAFGRDDFATFGATYFNNQIRDLINFTPTASGSTETNIGSAHVQGAEAELRLRATTWLTATLTYAYVDAKDQDAQSQLLRRPYHTASFNLEAHPWPNVTIAPELLFTGPFRDFLIDDNGFGQTTGMSRQGLLANLTVTCEVTPGVAIYANGRNIFNSRFEPVNGYQTPGATFLAGTRIHY